MYVVRSKAGLSPFAKNVVVLALPVALQGFIQSFLGMADVAMVSGLGPDAVAAVGLAAKLHFLMLVLSFGVGTACSVLTAQYCGAQNDVGARRTLSNSLVYGMGFSLPFALVFAFSFYWLGLINPDAGVVSLTGEFLLITAPVAILTQITAVYESALRSSGNTVVPLIGGVIAAILNIFLNWLLIFGHWGFPAMGVAGAAWATLIARCIQLAVTLLWLHWKDHLFKFSFQSLLADLQWVAFKKFAIFSVPLIVNHAIWGLGNASYHVATGFAGTHALAAMGVMAPVEGAFFALFMGLANASAVMVGQSLGADKGAEAWRLYRFYDRLTLILVTILSVSLWFCRAEIVTFFGGGEEDLFELLMDTMSIFCLCVWVKTLNLMRILGVLRAGGDTKFCLYLDMIAMWVFGLPLFVVAVFWGQSFLLLFALMFLEDALKCIPVVRRIHKKVWMKNLVGSESTVSN